MDEDECMICLEPLNNNVAVLSCGHKYHYTCIQQWSKKIKTYTKLCSVCDTDVEILNILNPPIIEKIPSKQNIKENKNRNNKIHPINLNNNPNISNNSNNNANNQQRYSFCTIM